ncbi:Acetyltransferase (GNAT) domain-containing protein [Catalinimonas alkaloidigena]|uniref:Acetyltransferase (GNAT) domain-containing protein n=1 Tax=Catalinimonas alkaloidigena TaxID=1075417 RepID=A0A1G9S5H5_9BACT|nr:GNAT family N-acetyltransferase [Catalinimonas alkaloidigena]SDM30577.1 Acetyltransferase (GNAT) domain-containing protein [Catalinimonas alkaloidigena]
MPMLLPELQFAQESDLTVAEFRELLIASTLGERRPIDDLPRLAQMLRGANLIVTARDAQGLLVGVARSITDFTYCTYLSDLAVRQSCQHQGIGKELIRRTQAAAPQATLLLLSAPAAEGYYPKIGMGRHPHCYLLRAGETLPD